MDKEMENNKKKNTAPQKNRLHSVRICMKKTHYDSDRIIIIWKLFCPLVNFSLLIFARIQNIITGDKKRSGIFCNRCVSVGSFSFVKTEHSLISCCCCEPMQYSLDYMIYDDRYLQVLHIHSIENENYSVCGIRAFPVYCVYKCCFGMSLIEPTRKLSPDWLSSMLNVYKTFASCMWHWAAIACTIHMAIMYIDAER